MVEELARFARRVLEVWQRLASSETVQAGLSFFVVLVLLTYLVRGRSAWSLRATLGAVATVVLACMNSAVAPVLHLLVDALRSFYDGLGLWRLPAETWAGAPVWVVGLVSAVAHDFANYWNHRLMHHRLLWPVHAVHHSEPDVHGLTTFRVHALEPIVMAGSYVLLLTWLSLPADGLPVLGLVLILHNMYVHADLDWTHGPLRYLIASPRFHRWHHADVPEAHGKNLANLFPLLDVIFGTYYCPGPCTAPLGASGVPQNDPFKLFLYPGAAWLAQVRSALARRLTTAASGGGATAPPAVVSVAAGSEGRRETGR